ncbi:MAG: acylphosphatase [Desulfobacterales bacterium]|nr:acylphosphatase [Desulfobacterales bacterium]
MSELSAVLVTVTGRVQGVFFRAETRNAAVSLGLTGYVRNMPEGTVQAVFQGTDAQLEQMLAWCRKGAPLSKVDRVDSRTISYQPEMTDFQIRY